MQEQNIPLIILTLAPESNASRWASTLQPSIWRCSITSSDSGTRAPWSYNSRVYSIINNLDQQCTCSAIVLSFILGKIHYIHTWLVDTSLQELWSAKKLSFMSTKSWKSKFYCFLPRYLYNIKQMKKPKPYTCTCTWLRLLYLLNKYIFTFWRAGRMLCLITCIWGHL